MSTRLSKAQAITVLSQALALMPNAGAYISDGPHYENAKGEAVGPHSPYIVKYSLFGAIYLAGRGLMLSRQGSYPPQFIAADVTDLLMGTARGMQKLDYAAMVSWVTDAITFFTGDADVTKKVIETAVPPKPVPQRVVPHPPRRESGAGPRGILPARGPSHQKPVPPTKPGPRAVPARRPQLPTPTVTKPRAPRASGRKQ